MCPKIDTRSCVRPAAPALRRAASKKKRRQTNKKTLSLPHTSIFFDLASPLASRLSFPAAMFRTALTVACLALGASSAHGQLDSILGEREGERGWWGGVDGGRARGGRPKKKKGGPGEPRGRLGKKTRGGRRAHPPTLTHPPTPHRQPGAVGDHGPGRGRGVLPDRHHGGECEGRTCFFFSIEGPPGKKKPRGRPPAARLFLSRPHPPFPPTPTTPLTVKGVGRRLPGGRLAAGRDHGGRGEWL